MTEPAGVAPEVAATRAHSTPFRRVLVSVLAVEVVVLVLLWLLQRRYVG